MKTGCFYTLAHVAGFRRIVAKYFVNETYRRTVGKNLIGQELACIYERLNFLYVIKDKNFHGIIC